MTTEKGHCYGKDGGPCASGCFGMNCSCPCDGCMEAEWGGLAELGYKKETVLSLPDPDFTFSDAVLKNTLEVAWQFLEKRGAREVRYAKSLELRLDLYFLGNKNEQPGEVRMLRTTGDWVNSAWEIEDHGFLFEIEAGKVSSPTIKDPEKARQECLKMCLSMMAIAGTKVEYDWSILHPRRYGT